MLLFDNCFNTYREIMTSYDCNLCPSSLNQQIIWKTLQNWVPKNKSADDVRLWLLGLSLPGKRAPTTVVKGNF